MSRNTLTAVHVLLFCASPVACVRDRVATIARDSGLREILPAVFRGQLTPYRKGLLVAAVESALRRARPYHLEILTLPEGHYLKRHVRSRG